MKEQRNCNYELRSESRTVEGYALVFDKESRDLGGFIEIIDPSSLDGVIEKSDILCLLNHNEDKGVLARSKFGVGSLSLLVDETGLKYRFEAPDTALGNELLEGLKRGGTISNIHIRIAKDLKGINMIDTKKIADSLTIQDETESLTYTGTLRNLNGETSMYVLVYYDNAIQWTGVPFMEVDPQA